MGKRTVHQVDAKPQLVVTTSHAPTANGDAAQDADCGSGDEAEALDAFSMGVSSDTVAADITGLTTDTGGRLYTRPTSMLQTDAFATSIVSLFTSPL